MKRVPIGLGRVPRIRSTHLLSVVYIVFAVVYTGGSRILEDMTLQTADANGYELNLILRWE